MAGILRPVACAGLSLGLRLSGSPAGAMVSVSILFTADDTPLGSHAFTDHPAPFRQKPRPQKRGAGEGAWEWPWNPDHTWPTSASGGAEQVGASAAPSVGASGPGLGLPAPPCQARRPLQSGLAGTEADGPGDRGPGSWGSACGQQDPVRLQACF